MALRSRADSAVIRRCGTHVEEGIPEVGIPAGLIEEIRGILFVGPAGACGAVTPSHRPTLADVAGLAGVSLKTASRALNDEYGVARATAERVHRAARELGFRPNRLASSLASGRCTSLVGLVISSLSDPFMAAVAGSVEELFATQGRQLVIAAHGNVPRRQRHIIQTLVEHRVDAVLLVPAPGDCGYLREEIEHGLVVTGLDRPLADIEADTVVVDNREGAFRAVSRFVVDGHRRIAVLADDSRLWTIQERYAGFCQALSRAGIVPDPELVWLDCHDAETAEREMRRMLAFGDPPTAVFAAQHITGRGVVRALHATEVGLPVVSVDEVADPDLLSDELVVVESGPGRLGRIAATMAGERLDGWTGCARRLVIPPTLVVPPTSAAPSPGEGTSGSAVGTEVRPESDRRSAAAITGKASRSFPSTRSERFFDVVSKM
jgi:LacI family transcriptional regulator